MTDRNLRAGELGVIILEGDEGGSKLTISLTEMCHSAKTFRLANVMPL